MIGTQQQFHHTSGSNDRDGAHCFKLAVLQMQTTSIAIQEDKHWKSLEDMCLCKGMNYRYVESLWYICIYLFNECMLEPLIYDQ